MQTVFRILVPEICQDVMKTLVVRTFNFCQIFGTTNILEWQK